MNDTPTPGPAFVAFVTVIESPIHHRHFPVVAIDFYPPRHAAQHNQEQQCESNQKMNRSGPTLTTQTTSTPAGQS